jgi:drug/metabolite transporter (DMT)-like permease
MKKVKALLVALTLLLLSCYPEDTGHWPNKPDPDDPWKWAMLIVVVMAALAGGWWYARRQAVR